MAFRKFVAASTRDCLRLMREALGGDAMIVSTRRTAEGVEVVGVSAHDMPPDNEPADDGTPASFGAAGVAMSEAVPSRSGLRPAANLWDGIEDEPVRLSPAARVLAQQDQGPLPSLPEDLPLARWPRVQPQQIAHLVRATRSEYGSPAHAMAMASGDPQALPVVTLGFSPSEAERRARQALSASAVLREPQADYAVPEAVAADEKEAFASQVAEPIVSEMRSMRGWLERQMEVMAWRDATQRDPRRRATWHRMVDAGFTPALARTVANRLPDGMGDEQVQQWLAEVLVRNLRVVDSAHGVVERGGCYALVGPTGVGKTTTAAKIATHCVVKYGAAALGLITTDQHRIGAVDQLRTYGQILGVQVYTARGADDLDTILAGMGDRRLVLIDTAGLGQRDDQINAHLQALSGAGIERLLVLPAGSHAEQAEDVVQAYSANGLGGIVISKLDEAVRLGGTLDAAIRHRLPLYYMTNGQRVPEDIHTANAHLLVHRALKPRNVPVFALDADELDWAHMPAMPAVKSDAGAHV